MKAPYLVAIVVCTMSAAVAQVSPEDHAAHHPDSTAPTEAPSNQIASAAVGGNMQMRMKSMEELMTKLGETKDPAERARLLADHRQKMHEQLGAMKQMGCAMGEEKTGDIASGSPGRHGMAGKQGGGMMAQGQMMKCHELTQTRMDMMVGMMDQMMRHAEAQAAK